MDVRSLLFGSGVRAAATVLLVLVVVAAAAVTTGVIGAPSVMGVDNSFGTVNESTTVIDTGLVVQNPNPVSLSYGGVGINYTVTMNDISMANGLKDGVSVGKQNTTVPFRTYMRNEKIPKWWVSHIRNGERTSLAVSAVVHTGVLGQTITATPVHRTIETDIIGQFNSSRTRSINSSRVAVDNPIAYINRTSARWGNVTSDRTPIEAQFVMYNPKSRPLIISELGYNITMNGIRMGEGKTEDIRVPPHSARTVPATINLDNQKLDQWWVSHLQNNQTTNLVIDFYAKFDLGVTTVRVPLKDTTYRKTIQTSIFCENGGCGARGGSDSAETTLPTTQPTRAVTTGSPDTQETTASTADETTQATTATTETSTDETTQATTTTTSDGGIL